MPRNIAQRRDLRNWSKADELIEIATAISQYAPRSVLPLNADKKPLVKGWREAGISLRQTCGIIRGAADRNPANHPMIAIRTGKASGLTVVDLDLKEAPGTVDLVKRRVAEIFGQPVYVVMTPSGGEHWYFLHNGEGNHNLRDSHGLPVDVKGEGGQVAIAPSWRSDGRQYRWRISADDAAMGWMEILAAAGKRDTPEGDDPFGLPTIKARALDGVPTVEVEDDNPSPAQRRAGVEDGDTTKASATVQGFRINDPVEDGARNDTLFRVVRSHAANGLPDDEVEAFAYDYNVRYMIPPLPDADVRKILGSIRKYKRENRLWRAGDEARAVVPISGIASDDLSDSAKVLMIFIQCQHSAHNAPFPLQADRMAFEGFIPGWGRDKYNKRRAELVDAGYLSVHHQGGKHGKGHASMYRITRPLGTARNFAAHDFRPDLMPRNGLGMVDGAILQERGEGV